MSVKPYVLSLFAMMLIIVIACEQTTDDEQPSVVSLFNSFISSPTDEFFQDSATINGWIVNNDSANLAKHSWEIWEYITKPTGKTDGFGKIRRFEHWLTDIELSEMTKNGVDSANVKRNHRGVSDEITQEAHAAVNIADSCHFREYVKYNPEAAGHALKYKLFSKATLNGMKKETGGDFVNFPDRSVVIKPVFYFVRQEEISSEEGAYYAIPTWHGEGGNRDRSYSRNAWDTYVYIDFSNQSSGGGNYGTNPNEVDCEGCVYNVDDFIHWRLTKEDVENHGIAGSCSPVKEGDYAILVAMHVTSREVERWTWQTFWWSRKPSTPHEPGTATWAAQRPSSLDAAAAHYSVAVGYSMINPVQPYTGGDNVGEPVFAYNPYLEAGFAGLDPLQTGKNPNPENYAAIKTASGTKIYQYGMETNCMTCHGMANFGGTAGYSSNTYIDFGTFEYYSADGKKSLNPYDSAYVRTDFLWSIPIAAQ